MSDVVNFNNSGEDDRISAVTDDIVELIYSRADELELTLASVVGILECVKHAIMTDHYN